MRERWRSDLSRFQEEVNKVVEESLNRIGDYWNKDGELRPMADVYDEEKEVILFVELPGIQRKDIGISLKGRSLSVTAEKKPPYETDTALTKGERHFGVCKRVFDLDYDIDEKSIEAVLRDGVLQIVVPKVVAEKSKIEIKVG